MAVIVRIQNMDVAQMGTIQPKESTMKDAVVSTVNLDAVQI